MFKKCIKSFAKLIFFMCFILSSSVSAAVWGPKENITEIEVGAGFVFFRSPSYTSCGSQIRLNFEATPSAREIYATLLTAYMKSKPVKLYAECLNGEYHVYRATL
jgi:hypothetical protein